MLCTVFNQKGRVARSQGDPPFAQRIFLYILTGRPYDVNKKDNKNWVNLLKGWL